MRRLLLLALLIAGCGGGDEPARPTAQPPKPSVTPFPTVDRASLEPGVEYATRAFTPNFRITLPEGEWMAHSADKPDHVEIEPDPEPPVQVAGIGFHHITQVFPPDEGGEIPGDAVEGPADFAEWLSSHPHLETTEPEPVEALGLKGVVIDVTVKSSQPKKYKDCGKVEGDCVVMYVGGIEPYVYGSETYGRFMVLDQPDGRQLVVEFYVEPRRAFRKQAKVFEQVLATAELTG